MKLGKSILAYQDIKEETVTIPEWGDVTVIVRGMTAACRARYAKSSIINMHKALCEVIIDNVFEPDTREPVFEKADVDALMEKSGNIIEGVATVILRLSGVDVPSWAQIEKNSEAALKT